MASWYSRDASRIGIRVHIGHCRQKRNTCWVSRGWKPGCDWVSQRQLNCQEVWHVGSAGHNLSRVQSGLYVLCCCRVWLVAWSGMGWRVRFWLLNNCTWCTRERVVVFAVEKANVYQMCCPVRIEVETLLLWLQVVLLD